MAGEAAVAAAAAAAAAVLAKAVTTCSALLQLLQRSSAPDCGSSAALEGVVAGGVVAGRGAAVRCVWLRQWLILQPPYRGYCAIVR